MPRYQEDANGRWNLTNTMIFKIPERASHTGGTTIPADRRYQRNPGSVVEPYAE